MQIFFVNLYVSCTYRFNEVIFVSCVVNHVFNVYYGYCFYMFLLYFYAPSKITRFQPQTLALAKKLTNLYRRIVFDRILFFDHNIFIFDIDVSSSWFVMTTVCSQATALCSTLFHVWNLRRPTLILWSTFAGRIQWLARQLHKLQYTWM